MAELNRPQLEELDETSKAPIWLVLDDVRSMNNVGSIFRTADAFNVAGIMLCGLTPCPPHRDIQKTALGATESVCWQHHPSVSDAIQFLKNEGFAINAVEQTHNSIALQEAATLKGSKNALIFGNEVKGVGDEALSLCENSLEIPQWGIKHSLNISVSVGIVLWEFLR